MSTPNSTPTQLNQAQPCCAARAAQVRAVVSGALGSFGPAPGRSGPARGWSVAVPRPERASGACLRAARARSCAKMRVLTRIGVNTWAWWCEYALGVAEWCRVRPLWCLQCVRCRSRRMRAASWLIHFHDYRRSSFLSPLFRSFTFGIFDRDSSRLASSRVECRNS